MIKHILPNYYPQSYYTNLARRIDKLHKKVNNN
jgi:hypothetical protein